MIKREKLIAALPLAIFGLLVLVLVVGLQRNDTDQSKFAYHVGDYAPATDLPLLGQDGARFDNTAWRGRPYIVNFFASWCQDCRAEHEELMTLAAGRLPLVGVAYKDRADRITAYLAKQGNPFSAVALDTDGRTGIDWGLTGVPETFLVDGNGIIRWHHIGRLTDSAVMRELLPLWQAVKRGN